MALSKSGKSGSNVTNLDEARANRAKSSNGRKRKDPSGTSKNKVAAQSEGGTRPARKTSNRRFDTVKVARIKDEIARGEYDINYLHVADKFIEHERYS